jgi:hypothetical protein
MACIGNLTNGGKIFIKAGTYSISSMITLNKGVMLIGECVRGEGDYGTTLRYSCDLAITLERST